MKKAVVLPKACVHFIIKSYISQEEDISWMEEVLNLFPCGSNFFFLSALQCMKKIKEKSFPFTTIVPCHIVLSMLIKG